MLQDIGKLFRARTYWAAAVLLLFTHSIGWSQTASGRVIGTVTDASGAAVSGAQVTVTNTATQTSRTTKSAEDGTYQVLDLPIGPYSVTAEQTGFAKTTTTPATLEINQSLRIDVKLAVGTVTESVQVQANASGVETVNATISGSVTTQEIIDLPLNGRNVLDLAGLQPGVTPTNPANGGAGSYTIAGGRSDSVTYLLDGGVNNNLLNNGVVFNPNPDTIQEFRILENNYTAEYGRNGGGVISVVTKSGTNEYHGSLFEYLRNEDFNANTFFNNQQNIARSPLKRNQFGGTFGGPVGIPKVFSGKDKLFFFFGYQGQRQVSAQVDPSVTVFTPAELSGNFSQSVNGGPDPLVVSYLQSHPYFQPNAALAAQGIIDPTRINSVAQNYIKAGLIPNAASGLQFPQGPATSNADEFTGRLDYNVSQNNRLSFTAGESYAPLTNSLDSSNVLGYPTTATGTRWFGNAAFTSVLRPTMINEFRFTAQRNNGTQAVPASTLPTAAQLGVGITPDNPSGPPILGFSSGATVGFSPQGPTNLIDNTYTTSDTFTWTKGRHNMKFGGAFTAYQNNTVYDFYVNGEYFFYGPSTSVGSGNDRADFLLGLPDEFLQFGAAPSNIRSKYTGFFAQDEWHVKPNLTVTFGLRYEYASPKTDTQGRSFSLAYGQQSTRFPNAPKGLLFPGDANAPTGSNFSDKNDFGPRFGFAYSPGSGGKTSIRGGFGMFYDILKAEDNLQYNGQAPFFGFADLVFNALPGNPTTQTNYYSAPFTAAGVPNSFPSKPPASNINFNDAGFLPFGGSGVYFVNPNLRTPYIFQYNLSIQREMFRNTTLEVSYVGSSSHKLTGLVDTNPFILGTTNRVYNVQPGAAASNFSYLETFDNVGKAHYNSLEASLRQRLTDSRFFGRTSFQLSYTYSHSIDNESGFREVSTAVPYYNHDQFMANSDYDLRHNLVFAGTWDLPFDHLTSHAKPVVGGWSLYPIIRYRTGFPINVKSRISASISRPGPSGAGDPNLVQANLVGTMVTEYDPHNTQSINGHTGNYYFSPANFNATYPGNPVTDPTARTYGTLGRNAFYGPGQTNVDLTLAKSFPIARERVTGQFRVDAFNLLNHTQFLNPNTSITSGTFGQITTTAPPRILQLVLRVTF